MDDEIKKIADAIRSDEPYEEVTQDVDPDDISPEDAIHISKNGDIDSRYKSLSRSRKQRVDNKPNGLWYAFGDSWMDFIRTDPTYSGEYYVYRLELDRSKIIRLSTADELYAFSREFGVDLRSKTMSPDMYDLLGGWIDWAKVAEKYGGIELVGQAVYAYNAISSNRRRDPAPIYWSYGWDADSGCVWDPDAVEYIESIGKSSIESASGYD